MESFESNKQGDSRDITLTEIRQHISDGSLGEALFLARHRLDGIKSIPNEIDQASAEAVDIKPDLWLKEKQALLAEREELEAIIKEIISLQQPE